MYAYNMCAKILFPFRFFQNTDSILCHTVGPFCLSALYTAVSVCLEKEMATHCSVLAGESHGRGSLVGCRLRGRTESDTTEATQQQQQQCLYAHPKVLIYCLACPLFGNPKLVFLSVDLFLFYT